jgi:hypothetical protein
VVLGAAEPIAAAEVPISTPATAANSQRIPIPVLFS